MTSRPEEETLFFILAHHDRHHLNRCIRIQPKNRAVFVCARCTGILIGFTAHIILSVTVLSFSALVGDILLFILPFSSVVDWITQSLGYRESINRIRISTGFLLGLDFAYRLMRFLKNPVDPGVLVSSAIYLSAVLAVAFVSMRRNRLTSLQI